MKSEIHVVDQLNTDTHIQTNECIAINTRHKCPLILSAASPVSVSFTGARNHFQESGKVR